MHVLLNNSRTCNKMLTHYASAAAVKRPIIHTCLPDIFSESIDPGIDHTSSCHDTVQFAVDGCAADCTGSTAPPPRRPSPKAEPTAAMSTHVARSNMAVL